jgi:hypothetical protein
MLNGICRRNTDASRQAGDTMNHKEFNMKRFIIVIAIASIALAGASAQGFGQMPGPGGPGMQAAAPQAITTIEGKLSLVQGHPALAVKDKTYFVRLPQFMYGFIDGLKEGATVKLDGYEMAIPYATNSFFFHATKLTLGAKVYDLAQFTGGMGMKGGMMGGRQGGGPGGRFSDDNATHRGRW